MIQELGSRTLCILAVAFLLPAAGFAQSSPCGDLPNQAALQTALNAAVLAETSGLNLHMWATLVNRDGIVCAVAFSGTDRGAQWPGSRVISAQKANTANAFSLDSSSSSGGSGKPNGLALSTANLYSAVQPGGTVPTSMWSKFTVSAVARAVAMVITTIVRSDAFIISYLV